MIKTIQLGSRRELFVDDALLLDAGHMRLTAHAPMAAERVLFPDAPADGRTIGYPSIFRDGKKIRLYYLCNSFAEGDAPQYEPVRTSFAEVDDGGDKPAHSLTRWPHTHIGYAESEDGINWTKPELGIYEFKGSRKNHITYMLPGDMLDNFSAGIDTNPACPPDKKYKALCERVIGGRAVLNAVASPDGLHWTDLGTVVTKGTFDSLNTWFWDAEAGLYRAYVRTWLHHHPWRDLGESGRGETTHEHPTEARSIATCVSADFINWSEPEDLCYGGAPEYQLYTNNVRPYYRAPHILVGFPSRYYERTWLPVFDELPDAEDRRARSAKMMRSGTALSDSLFMSSRNGVDFRRWDFPAFLPPGPEKNGNWRYGDGYLAYALLETPSAEPGAANELTMYAKEKATEALRRYTLRLDGFVSLSAGYPECDAITHPLTFDGAYLSINYATSVAGRIRIELLDAHLNPIEGYSMGDCDDLVGDSVGRRVSWRGLRDVSPLRGRVVSMRIRMREADLYSFQFSDEG